MNRNLWRAWRACFLAAYVCLATGGAFGQVASQADILTTDFVVPAGAPKKVMVVGGGATTDKLSPHIQLMNTAGGVLASSDTWSSADDSIRATLPRFSHPSGAPDAALSATLDPGTYTVVMSRLQSATTPAGIEIYDVTATPTFIHIAARGYDGTGPAFSPSFTVPAGSTPRKLLLRAAGPGLASVNPAALTDPELTILNASGGVVATNDDWSPDLVSTMTQAGAFPFAAWSKDSALVMDFSPGTYTARSAIKTGIGGVVLVDIYDITPPPVAVVTLGKLNVHADVSYTAALLSTPAQVVFSRTGDTSKAVTVAYTLSGTAVAGTDYSGLSGTIVIPAGATSATAAVTALPDAAQWGSKTAVITLSPQAGYDIGEGSATVYLFYGNGTLYLANLRPPSGVVSNAFGTGTVQLSADERYLYITLNLSGLSSPETVSYLRLSNAGEDGAYLVRLPAGGSSARQWQIQASGGYTAADIVAALKAGKIYISVGSENFPSGELRGTFLVSNGSQDPNPPPPPPNDVVTPEAASRFLTQSTFGPTKAEIDALVAKGFATWLSDQMAVPQSLHKDAALDDFTTYNTNATLTRPQGSNRQAAWWKISVTGPDQLRQRVAFALSEIFVISDVNGTVANWEDGAANYYDLLARNAFGNFRTLLEDVTLSPMMGVYLSHIRNSKATATTEPDENFAREVMQLFTIGLNQLNADGTLKLDGNGLPIPTYDQKTISEMAKVFTGWQFNNPNPTKTNFRSGGGTSDDYMKPMTLNPNFHEDSAKTIVGNLVLPANQGGVKDLADTLNALFNHPNTAPFISRQLIQRLVTSNPSSGYIGRVSQVFANNGSGVRGDLGAVIKAILLDPEARSGDVANGANYGKLKEPLLRVTALLRAFNGSAENGRFAISNPEGALAEAALRSPTVFNFFEPAYVVPGPLASAGLYAPEYQILTDTTAISVPNNLYTYINNTRGPTTIGLDLSGMPPTSSPAAIVDYLNLLFCSGSMPTAMKDRIVTALNAMPKTATDLDKYRAAIYITVSTQEASIQK